MIENIVPHEEGRQKFEEIKKKLALDESVVTTNIDEVNSSLSANKTQRESISGNEKLQDFKLKPFTEEDAEKMNKRFPDTF